MKKVQMILKRGIILLMSISVLCSTKTIHAYECENEECVEIGEGFTEYLNNEEIIKDTKIVAVNDTNTNFNSDYQTFNEKRENFWYYYGIHDTYYWSLEWNGDLLWWRTGDLSTQKLYKQNVCAYYSAYDTFIYVENEINVHMVDYDGENDEFVFSAPEKVREIVGNREYYFYLTDVGVYRYHVGSNTNEFVCVAKEGFWLSVYDNQSFCFCEDHGEIAYTEEDGYYLKPTVLYYDMANPQQGIVNMEEMEAVPLLNIDDRTEVKRVEDNPEIEFLPDDQLQEGIQEKLSEQIQEERQNEMKEEFQDESSERLEVVTPEESEEQIMEGLKTENTEESKEQIQEGLEIEEFDYIGNGLIDSDVPYAFISPENNSELILEDSLQDTNLGDTLISSRASGYAAGLDFTDYGIDSFFTYNHKACNHDKDGDSNCYFYPGGIQCAGYASYAYNLFHGHNKTVNERVNIFYEENDKERGVPISVMDWMSLPSGTYVRTAILDAKDKKTIYLRHSIFIYENDGTYMTIYEANKNGDCKITEKKVPIVDMPKLYNPGRFFHPTFEHVCIASSAYKYDEKTHWNTCEKGCLRRINMSEHTAGNWYNNGSEHSRNCTVCNKVMESKGHVLSGYLSDGTYHWRECVECGAVVEKSAHNSANVVASETGHSYFCSICGRTISTTGHTYNSQYNLDGSHHWHNCSLAGCSSISGKETHAYSYSRVDASTHKGTCKCGHVITGSHNMRIGQPSSTAHQLICSTCGAVSSETHSYTISQNNGSTHKKTCSKCGYSVSEAHSVVYTNASAGSHSLRCSTCGYTETSAHTRITTKTKVATASICTRTAVKCKCNYVISTTTDRTHRYSGKTCLDCGYKK